MLSVLRGLAALVLACVVCASAPASADMRGEFKPSGKIWTVDEDGGGDFATISEAIEAAAPGDGIRVHPGVYREALSIEKEIYIESADGDRDGVVVEAENNPCVYFAAERGAVRGMTLRNSGYQGHTCVHIVAGRFLLADNNISSETGGGVRMGGADVRPAVIGNRIHGSKEYGIYMERRAKGRFEDNDIYGNGLSGVEVKLNADPVFTGNRIYKNEKDGVYVQAIGKGRFENNEIYQNKFSGAYVTTSADPVFIKNRVYDNKEHGIAAVKGGKGVYEDNEISGNKKEQFVGPADSLPDAAAAIGVLEFSPDSGDGHHCTAFLAGPDVVVTAAHCVMSYSGDLHEPGELTFRSIAADKPRSAGAVKFLHVGEYNQYSAGASTFGQWMAPMGGDIAVIQISEPLGGETGWLPKGKIDWDEIAGGGEYEIIGAPDGSLIRLQPCRVHPEVLRMWEGIYSSVHKAFERGVFFHTCPTGPGYSGSPVLREDNGGLTWIGVHSSGITIDWTGYPRIEGVGTSMILQPGGGYSSGE